MLAWAAPIRRRLLQSHLDNGRRDGGRSASVPGGLEHGLRCGLRQPAALNFGLPEQGKEILLVRCELMGAANNS
jgi:hypothetical protein